jgi:hypothetical protein
MGTIAQHRSNTDQATQAERVAQAGTKLRTQWLENALTVQRLAPLTLFVMRAHRERWPDSASVGAAVYDLNSLAEYIHGLEARIAVYEDGAA